MGPGIEVALRVDAFGLIFAITSSFLWILVEDPHEGGLDAASLLAAQRHGGPHPGQFPAACRGRGEGRRLWTRSHRLRNQRYDGTLAAELS